VNRAPAIQQRVNQPLSVDQDVDASHTRQPLQPTRPTAQLTALDADGQRAAAVRRRGQPLTDQSFTVLPNIASQNVDDNGDELYNDGGVGGAGTDWEVVDMSGDPARGVIPRRGKLVTFYRNGDPHFKVIIFIIP